MIQYAPSAGNLMTAAAWQKSEALCEGEATHIPTPNPTPKPAKRPTHSPSVFPTKRSTTSPTPQLKACAPLFTEGYEYSLLEEISFDRYNYVCQIPESCSDVRFAPRSDTDITSSAWWKNAEPCLGEATRRPTPVPTSSKIPTQRPTKTEKPTIRPTTEPPAESLEPCAPLFTHGHRYSLNEEISFEHFNYVCGVPDKCSQVQYAPRSGADLEAVAWWKLDRLVDDRVF